MKLRIVLGVISNKERLHKKTTSSTDMGSETTIRKKKVGQENMGQLDRNDNNLRRQRNRKWNNNSFRSADKVTFCAQSEKISTERSLFYSEKILTPVFLICNNKIVFPEFKYLNPVLNSRTFFSPAEVSWCGTNLIFLKEYHHKIK